MHTMETALPEIKVLMPRRIGDIRGFFSEVWNARDFASIGIEAAFVQDNHIRNPLKGTLRGLHYQLRHPQAKLCRVIQGEVLDVVVDVRHGSPHFGKWESGILSAENKREMYVPAGFAHGYLVLSETAEFLYKCSDFYHPEYERGVLWNDPEIGINWGVQGPLLSDKDRRNPPLSGISLKELPEYRRG